MTKQGALQSQAALPGGLEVNLGLERNQDDSVKTAETAVKSNNGKLFEKTNRYAYGKTFHEPWISSA